jgi:hypothetical protein
MMKGVLMRQEWQLEVDYLNFWPNLSGKIQKHSAVFPATPKNSGTFCVLKSK